MAKVKKAEAKKAPAPVDFDRVRKGRVWTPGSSAQLIFEALQSFKNGATPDEVLKKVQGKFESSNPKGRVSTILRAAVKRDLATRGKDGLYKAKPKKKETKR